MRKERKNEKGFTMVELIIVVAIMGIIGALLVPAYGTMTTKARLTTDISTVKTLKRTAESVKAETGKYPTSTTIEALSTELKNAGYLDQVAKLQTVDAKISVTPPSDTTPYSIKLDLSTAVSKDDTLNTVYTKLADDAKDWITGIAGGSGTTGTTDTTGGSGTEDN